MIVVLMTKLVVALSKQVVKANFSETGNTILTCLIDFVSAQESATQKMLARVERKIDDIHQNPFRLGGRMLLEAQRVNDGQLKRDRIQKALDAFTQAAEYTQISDPLLPLKARLSAGACYDLLLEGNAALANYEEVFRHARELQKIARKHPATKDGSEAIREVMSDPLDAFIGWLETKEQSYKERERLRAIVLEIKPELDDFVEKLLLLILSRNGLTREQYLGVPKKQKKQPARQTNSFTQTQRSKLPSFLAPVQDGSLSFSLQRRMCPNCKTAYVFKPCTMCHGTKMQGTHPCVSCSGTGSIRTCKCTTQLSNGLVINSGNRIGKTCLLCHGTGKVSWDHGITWRPCLACGGTGRQRF